MAHADIPEGREGEFLNDAQLAEHFAAKLAKAKKGDPGYAELAAQAARAKYAAIMTSINPAPFVEDDEEG